MKQCLNCKSNHCQHSKRFKIKEKTQEILLKWRNTKGIDIIEFQKDIDLLIDKIMDWQARR